MAHVAGACGQLLLWGVLLLAGLYLSILLPIKAWKWLGAGVITIDSIPIRRTQHPLLFWLLLLTVIPWLILMGAEIDFVAILLPLWHLATKQ